MRILDRYILRSFLVNYLLALGVMVGMYVLLDLIVNVQDFARGASSVAVGAANTGASPWEVAVDMLDYYFFQLPMIYQQVAGIIPTLAAGFTMVRMTRHHELTAMLASGVSLYRVAAPIILLSMGFAALTVVNQEFIISQPYEIEKLLRKHDEVNQAVSKNEPLLFIKDQDGSLLSARDYDPANDQMTDVIIVARDKTGMPIRHIVADSAHWEVPAGELTPAWVMHGVREADDTAGHVAEGGQVAQRVMQEVAQKIDTEVLKTSLTPEQLDLILSKKAVDFLSSAQVRNLARFSPEVNRPLLYKIMNLRFTQPLMNIIMLLIGIPFLLTREPSRLVVNMFYCTAVSGVIFIATFVIFQMGGTQLDPLWAAWIPVLMFLPLSLVMMDTIKT